MIRWRFLSQDFLNVFQRYERIEKDIKQIGWGRGQNLDPLPH